MGFTVLEKSQLTCVLFCYLFSEDEAREAREVSELPDSLQLIKPSSNSEYINRICKRLNEDAKSREEREKRRRKVLQDQLKAHEAQEVSHGHVW